MWKKSGPNKTQDFFSSWRWKWRRNKKKKKKEEIRHKNPIKLFNKSKRIRGIFFKKKNKGEVKAIELLLTLKIVVEKEKEEEEYQE